jgi:hypothetical protein
MILFIFLCLNSKKIRGNAVEKGNYFILPYAGITLTRFSGMISDCRVMLRSRSRTGQTPREHCKLKPLKSKAKNFIPL